MLKNKFGMLQLVMWHIFGLLIVYINYTSAECNVCQSNQAACVNSTSFYLCFGDKKPNTNILYHCKDGFDCTDLSAICVQTSSQRPPSCGDTSLCGMCAAHRNFLFACLSRTTFQMCYGAIRPTGQIGYCPPGYVCHGGSDAVCVLEGSVDSVTCDIVDDGGIPSLPSSTTSTTAKPTISTSKPGAGSSTEYPGNENLTPAKVCAEKMYVGLYPTVPNDPYCKRYIYCHLSNGIMTGIEYNCGSGSYFHIQQQKCVFNKPTYCM
ncbi:uncharacterized protein ACRADG_003714 [Cochliomyia hominivorax]